MTTLSQRIDAFEQVNITGSPADASDHFLYTLICSTTGKTLEKRWMTADRVVRSLRRYVKYGFKHHRVHVSDCHGIIPKTVITTVEVG